MWRGECPREHCRDLADALGSGGQVEAVNLFSVLMAYSIVMDL